mmetsp:Transcript_22793/g.41432  ORF Transcript_22793/g.41432 Transcript_22793/m.41432 type:complete len:289 (-) Transcript_22793:34-900(-)
MQRETNEGYDTSFAKRNVPSHHQTLHRQSQLSRNQNSEGRILEMSSALDENETVEQAKKEARRESNRRSAKNNRLRQKDLIATLQAENQFLRTELIKAFNRIDQLKMTLEQETERALHFNRCLQLLVENNMTNQQESREKLHPTSGTSSTVSTGPTLSRLLEMARSIDGPSSFPIRTSSVEPYQGYGHGNRLLVDEMMRGGEQTAASFASRRTSYLSETYPSADNATTSDRGVIYPSAFYSRNYIPLASQSSTGRVGESGTIAAELNRIIRLEEELKIIKSYMTNAKK